MYSNNFVTDRDHFFLQLYTLVIHLIMHYITIYTPRKITNKVLNINLNNFLIRITVYHRLYQNCSNKF